MLLALDTATATASLAVYNLESSQLLAELTWQARRRQTQDLLLAARTLLAQVEITPSDLTSLAVTTGPGSFTGVRIGISAVKGMALGLPTPPQVIGIPTLNVTAAPWLAVASSMPGVTICAYMQAGRGRYNWRDLSAPDPMTRLTAEAHQNGTVDEFVDQLQGQSNHVVWLVGETTVELQDRVKSLAHVVCVDEVSGWRRAGHLAQLAADYLQAGVADTLSELQPIYLRQP